MVQRCFDFIWRVLIGYCRRRIILFGFHMERTISSYRLRVSQLTRIYFLLCHRIYSLGFRLYWIPKYINRSVDWVFLISSYILTPVFRFQFRPFWKVQKTFLLLITRQARIQHLCQLPTLVVSVGLVFLCNNSYHQWPLRIFWDLTRFYWIPSAFSWCTMLSLRKETLIRAGRVLWKFMMPGWLFYIIGETLGPWRIFQRFRCWYVIYPLLQRDLLWRKPRPFRESLSEWSRVVSRAPVSVAFWSFNAMKPYLLRSIERLSRGCVSIFGLLIDQFIP